MTARKSIEEQMVCYTLDPKTDCWLWAKSLNADGYGQFTQMGQHFLAHRASYEFHIGPIPTGLLVCHECDVRSCINPDHLFTGTNLDNRKDCAAKGRERPANGERVNTAKLTEAEVISILADPRNGDELAEAYKVHNSTISRIKTRKRWKHLG